MRGNSADRVRVFISSRTTRNIKFPLMEILCALENVSLPEENDSNLRHFYVLHCFSYYDFIKVFSQ